MKGNLLRVRVSSLFSTLCAMPFTVRRVSEEKKPSALKKYGRFLLPAMRSLMAMKEHLQHTKHEEDVQKREMTLKKTIAILVAVLIVLLLLIGTLKAVLRLKELALGMASVAGVELPKDENGFTNILLLGEGDNDHEGVNLTDTVIVASLDPNNTRSAVLISIPRDTYILNSEKMGKGRINSLYRDYKVSLVRKGMKEPEASSEAMKQLNVEVGSILGLTIHGSVKVNFSGFTEAVDAIGGIDIDVSETLVDTEYPGANYSYVTFSINKGLQHLDGETALKYARSRHSTSDFSRSARQQQIITAIVNKTKEEGIIKNVGRLTELLSIMAKNVESTLSTRELLGLASLGKSIEPGRMISVQLNDQNGLFGSGINEGGFLYAPPREEFGGAAVLLPVSIPAFPVTWKQVRAYVTLLTKQRSIFLHPSRIIVLNAGAKEGAARKLGGELYRYDFNVQNTRNYVRVKNPSFAKSFLIINPALSADPTMAPLLKLAQNTAATLGIIFKMEVLPDPQGEAFTQDDADIAIVLGEDFQYTPLQERL